MSKEKKNILKTNFPDGSDKIHEVYLELLKYTTRVVFYKDKIISELHKSNMDILQIHTFIMEYTNAYKKMKFFKEKLVDAIEECSPKKSNK